MDRESFERKLSEWLDNPQCDKLRAVLDRAVAQTPRLYRIRADWQRLSDVLKSTAATPEGVEWRRLRSRILKAVLEPGDDSICP